MMRYRALASCCCMAMTIAGPASAGGWKQAKWGMTLSQVGGIIKGLNQVKRKVDDKSEYQTMLVGTVSLGSFNFESSYQFDKEERLGAVSLKLKNYEKCAVLRKILRTKYGRADFEGQNSGIEFIEWSDKTRYNLISLFDASLTSGCLLTYEKLDYTVFNAL